MKKIILFMVPFFLQAQVISLKTIPVVTGDQFLLFPAQNTSIGGVSVALNDAWQDPFVNPARSIKNNDINIFLVPTFYYVSDNLGGAQTLPLAVGLHTPDYFGAAMISYQQMESTHLQNNGSWQPWWDTAFAGLSETRHTYTNAYYFFSVGKQIGPQGWSLGASVFRADLKAMNGVDLLYNNSYKIRQDGTMYEGRLGALYAGETSELSVLFLYNNYDMQQAVSYRTWFWDPVSGGYNESAWTENNPDRTDTWGFHANYKEQVDDSGLKLGVTFTTNYKTHPKIPNYSIMNIPRDPGNTWAFNLGLGVGKETETSRVGVDFIYEPIRSKTWATAHETIDLGNGKKLNPGDKTVDNDFRFNNWILRFGMHKNVSVFGFGAGMEIYDRNYSLSQLNYQTSTSRSQDENWTEVTWNWGANLKFKHFTVAYNGRLITGTGIPGVNGGWIAMADVKATADYLVAPSGSLTVDEAQVMTHRFIVEIPLDKTEK